MSSANMGKTMLLLAGLMGLFAICGHLIAGPEGMLLALGAAVLMNIFAYWNSAGMVLRLYRAHPISETSHPQLYATVATLARRAGLPMPKLYLIDTDQPNAFATGRSPSHAAVAATTGLLRRLTPEEAAGVLAHELAHIRHWDILTMTLTAVLAGGIGLLGHFMFLFGRGQARQIGPAGMIVGLALMILAPIAATLVRLAISREREYQADQAGAQICGHPDWLASALLKIDASTKSIDYPTAQRNPGTAHLFIINPLRGKGLSGLFCTHPSTEDRVQRLRALDATGQSGGVDAGLGRTGQAGFSPWAPRPRRSFRSPWRRQR